MGSHLQSAWNLTVIAVLAGWFVASAFHQVRSSRMRSVARRDVLHLLPRWSFFAPNPGTHDLHLVFRDFGETGPGPWQEIAATWSPRSVRWFWNPHRFPNKGLTDLTNGLLVNLPSAREIDDRAVLFSTPYLALLRHVMHQPGGRYHAIGRQFALVRSQGVSDGRELSIVFVSEQHRFDADPTR